MLNSKMIVIYYRFGVNMKSSYHGFLGFQEAEVIIRNSGNERGYLTRQSVTRPGFFILSFQEKGKIIHHVAPNEQGKYNKQSYDAAESVLDEMIKGKEECEEPLSPPNYVH